MDLYLWGFVIGFAVSASIAYLPMPYSVFGLLILTILGALIAARVHVARDRYG